jgi:pseudouridine synthase
VISTARDPEGRPNVVDMVDLPHDLAARVFPVGRLDADSTGLILLTNDGELANRLTHPRYEVPKQYAVSIKGWLSEDDMERLKKGVYLAKPRKPKGEGRSAKGDKDSPRTRDLSPLASRPSPLNAKRASVESVRLLGRERDVTRGDRTKVLLTLTEGQNREIRRLMARLGFKVRRLQRVAIGPVTLKGLGSGQWRLLTGIEIDRLKKSAGL